MFKHHKYCVIDVSGLLVAFEAPKGLLDVYLLDGATSYRSGSNDDAKMQGMLPAGDKSKRIKITDPGLIEFLCRELPRGEGECRFSCLARVAGPVGVDGGDVQLSYISQAFIHDKGRLLKYEPAVSDAN